jgi:hypothetical protein
MRPPRPSAEAMAGAWDEPGPSRAPPRRGRCRRHACDAQARRRGARAAARHPKAELTKLGRLALRGLSLTGAVRLRSGVCACQGRRLSARTTLVGGPGHPLWRTAPGRAGSAIAKLLKGAPAIYRHAGCRVVLRRAAVAGCRETNPEQRHLRLRRLNRRHPTPPNAVMSPLRFQS